MHLYLQVYEFCLMLAVGILLLTLCPSEPQRIVIVLPWRNRAVLITFVSCIRFKLHLIAPATRAVCSFLWTELSEVKVCSRAGLGVVLNVQNLLKNVFRLYLHYWTVTLDYILHSCSCSTSLNRFLTEWIWCVALGSYLFFWHFYSIFLNQKVNQINIEH